MNALLRMVLLVAALGATGCVSSRPMAPPIERIAVVSLLGDELSIDMERTWSRTEDVSAWRINEAVEQFVKRGIASGGKHAVADVDSGLVRSRTGPVFYDMSVSRLSLGEGLAAVPSDTLRRFGRDAGVDAVLAIVPAYYDEWGPGFGINQEVLYASRTGKSYVSTGLMLLDLREVEGRPRNARYFSGRHCTGRVDTWWIWKEDEELSPELLAQTRKQVVDLLHTRLVEQLRILRLVPRI